jgi:hypothetical protein
MQRPLISDINAGKEKLDLDKYNTYSSFVYKEFSYNKGKAIDMSR